MLKSRLILVSTCLAALLPLTQCSAPTSDGGTGTGGDNGTAGTTGSGGSGNTTGTAGTMGAGGSGNTTGTAGTTGSAGSGNATGTGGSATGTGGSATGTAGRGGTTGTAGTVGTAGTTGSAGRGGTTGTAGTVGTAGTAGTAGTTGTAGAAGTGVRMDQAGVPLAKPGDTTNVTKKYLNLGDLRLINNRWGSDALNCTSTQQSVFVNSDRSVGYMFTRPACGGARADPDFPEVEFGVAPFGTASSLLTSPAFSSTTLLPIQIKNLTSASVNVNAFTVSISGSSPYWDNNVEFWISKNDPRTSADGGVYAEIIAFTGWQASRLSTAGGWPCDKTGTVSAGTTSYNLCHQSDSWNSGSVHWRFFNFNVSGGPFSSWTSKLDVKAMLTWVMNNYSGFTTDMWLTRIEVGTEVDDSTTGTARISGLTFEVNGTNKSIELQ